MVSLKILCDDEKGQRFKVVGILLMTHESVFIYQCFFINVIQPLHSRKCTQQMCIHRLHIHFHHIQSLHKFGYD